MHFLAWTGLAFAGGAMAGAASTFFGVGGRTLNHGEYVEIDDVAAAILLFGHDGSGVDEAIDIYSRRAGICHAALHVGLTDADGNPMLIESWPRTGVRLRSPDDYREREVIVVPLSADDTAYARQAALAHLHRRTPYRGRPGGLTCSEFVVACLPSRLRKMFRTGLVTPAQLAEGLMESRRNVAEMKDRLLK